MVALEGAYVPLYYNSGSSSFTLPPFIRYRNGEQRELVAATLKVYQRPQFSMRFYTGTPVNETFGYRVSVESDVFAYDQSNNYIGYNWGIFSSSKRSGRFFYGSSDPISISMSGPNNVTLDPNMVPQADSEDQTDGLNWTAIVYGNVNISDVTLKTAQGWWMNFEYGYPYGFTTVVAIYTYNVIPV